MLNLTRAWLFYSAVMCAAGWVLSSLGRLDAIGYAAVLMLLAVAGIFWARAAARERPWAVRWRRAVARRGRFGRWLPKLFFALAFVTILGGALHLPSQADALQYRTPRVLHWLSAGHWHWIHAWDQRLNVISCGFEWLTAPLLALTRSDRALFLVNAISFVLLPGLVFGVFRQLGVKARVAWQWMWLLPAGWVYAMQAGGLGNDQFAAVYSLSAVYFGLRARETKKFSDVLFSLLATALITGTKQTNVPLALLGFIAVWPAWRVLGQRPWLAATAAVLGLLASGLPMLVIDLAKTGYWTGWPPEQALQPASPFWGVAGNSFVLLAYNFMPPVFPFAGPWNEARARFLESSWGEPFRSFEMFANMPRAAAEQTAALGLFVSLLVLLAWMAGRGKLSATARPRSVGAWLAAPGLIRWTAWGLLLLYLAKVGSWNAPRYLAAYYPLLLPAFLLGAGQPRVIRTRWWRGAACAVLAATVLLLVFSRQRPVWPARWITTTLERQFPEAQLIRKVREAYEFPPRVAEPLEPAFLEKIPGTEKVIGYATRYGGLDRQLWLPLGARRVERVKSDDPPERLRSLGVRFLLLDHHALTPSGLRLEDWLTRYDAELVASTRRSFGPELPALECHLLRLRPAAK